MLNAIISLVCVALSAVSSAEPLRFPDVQGMLEGARNVSAEADTFGPNDAVITACDRDPYCLFELSCRRRDGTLVNAKLKADKVERRAGGVTSMKRPYVEVPGFPFAKRYSLGLHRAIDGFVCRELGSAPHPARVLDSVFLNSKDVARMAADRVVISDRKYIFLDLLVCQHNPDTAYE
jgi:hypothetical protein